MQKKKVLLLTYGNIDHASSRIRGVNHFNRLKSEFDATWIPRVGIHHQRGFFDRVMFIWWKFFYLLQKYFCVLFCKYDLVFIQILFLPEWMLKIFKRKGTVICFDFDDAIYTYSRLDFDRMIGYADKVVIASPFLAESFDVSKKDYSVIYSPVDTDKILPAKEEHAVYTIGWIGSPWTLLHLESIYSSFIGLANQFPFKLLVVGGNAVIKGVNVECIPWSEENELLALRRMDIGIMPLEKHEWSPKKGGYKLYLYMAAGLAVIGTPEGINGLIIKDGYNGYCTRTEDDWVVALKKLYQDKELRKKMGANARNDAIELYSYKTCTSQLFSFLGK